MLNFVYRNVRVALFATAAFVGTIASMPVQAQGEGNGPLAAPAAAWVGVGVATPSCPQLTWQVRRTGPTIVGMMWYTDLSGASSMRGTMAQDGKFSVTLASVMGAGPTGNITGTRSADGALVADLDGPGCAKLHIRSVPAPITPDGGG